MKDRNYFIENLKKIGFYDKNSLIFDLEIKKRKEKGHNFGVRMNHCRMFALIVCANDLNSDYFYDYLNFDDNFYFNDYLPLFYDNSYENVIDKNDSFIDNIISSDKRNADF